LYQTLLLNDLSQAAAEWRWSLLMFFLVTNAKTNAPKIFFFILFHRCDGFQQVCGLKSVAPRPFSSHVSVRLFKKPSENDPEFPCAAKNWSFYSSLTRKLRRYLLLFFLKFFPACFPASGKARSDLRLIIIIVVWAFSTDGASVQILQSTMSFSLRVRDLGLGQLSHTQSHLVPHSDPVFCKNVNVYSSSDWSRA